MNAQTTARTAGPWIVVSGANPIDKSVHDKSFGHYGVTFATVSFAHEYAHMPEYGAKMAAEYADRIVRACNAHDDLVAALRDAPCTCGASDTGIGMLDYHHSTNNACFQNIARATLAKAGAL